jgi:hypothetical protein
LRCGRSDAQGEMVGDGRYGIGRASQRSAFELGALSFSGRFRWLGGDLEFQGELKT